MVRSIAKALTVAAILLPGITAAEPSKGQLKSGLWNLKAWSAEASSIVLHSQLCVAGPLKVEQLLGRPLPPRKSNCSKVRNEQTAEGFVDEVKCDGPEHTFHTVMTRKMSEMRVDVTVVSELDGGPGQTARQRWDWAGSCPSGMKIGQLLIQRPPTQ